MVDKLRSILYPRTVALVGVSSRPESLSGRLLSNMFAAGYTGAVYPVNPRVRALKTLRCYPSIEAIPEPVDLAIIMVRQDAAVATVEMCLRAGVRGLVLITAGFSEMGADGAAVERQVVAQARHAGVPLVGPNCMGVMNLEPEVRLDATFTPAPARFGAVALASHSGALGVALIEAVRDIGLGFSHFVSLGNSADINVCDVLELWEEHDATRAIMLYLEAIEEPRRFLEVASRVTRRKPVIAVKSGRTAEGQRAAVSHTGALAAGDTAIDALLRQAGVLRVETLAELVDLARAFEGGRLPAGRRVAVVSNAGGPAIIATDALIKEGLRLAELGEETQEELRSFLPPEATVGNPVDMLPSATPEHYGRAVELVCCETAVDATMVITVTAPAGDTMAIAEAVAQAARVTAKPVLPVFMTDPAFYGRARVMPDLPPVFAMPESATRALGGLVRHARQVSAGVQAGAVAQPLISPTLGGIDAEGVLGPADSLAVLGEAGIAVAPWRLARDHGGVLAGASSLGFPVVLTAFGPEIVHKSELGAVAVGLASEAELEGALAAMGGRLRTAGVRADGFLLQRQIDGGREAIVGISRDPLVGPLVMCGLGGVAVEVWQDVSFRIAPVSRAQAAEMVAELRGARLLGPFRGRPAADVGALEEVIVNLSRLAAGHPELLECDLNPLIVLDDGAGCVAVDARFLLAVPGSPS